MTFIPQFEPLIEESYAEAVKQQILSGWIGPAKTTQAFEQKICEITGSKYCIVTTSGTAALMLAISSLELLANSTIIFPSYTFLAGANAASYLGHKVKLCDISRKTMSLDPDHLDLENTSAVIFVNHNGYVGADVKRVKDACNEWGVPMIEDSSQALGIANAGRLGDLGIFSFSVPKLVTTGQGGAVITDDPALYEKCLQYRDQGGNWRKTRIHNKVGINLKFNDILAAYGLAQLNVIDQLLAKRKTLFDRYRQHIDLEDFGYESAWMAIYETDRTDEIITQLRAHQIQAVKYYKPINHNPPYFTKEAFLEAEYASERYLYLPSSLVLNKDTVDKICYIINEKK